MTQETKKDVLYVVAVAGLVKFSTYGAASKTQGVHLTYGEGASYIDYTPRATALWAPEMSSSECAVVTKAGKEKMLAYAKAKKLAKPEFTPMATE